MRMSRDGLNRLIASEGSIPYVYDDGDGTWPKRRISDFNTQGYPTIGVGHRIYEREQPRFRKYLAGGQDMTMREIQELLAEDINSRIASESWKATIRAPVTQAMYDALVHQAFNVGPNASSIRRAIEAINNRDYQGAQAALASGAVTSRGRRLEGLVRRRALEAEMFMADGLPGSSMRVSSLVPTSSEGIPRLLLAAYGATAVLLLVLAIRRASQERAPTRRDLRARYV